MLLFVYVEFDVSRQRPQDQPTVNEYGLAMSYEPAKWNEILHFRVKHVDLDDIRNRDYQMLRSTIKYCWPAGPHFPTTLNLMLDMDEDQHDFEYIHKLMKELFLGSIHIGVASEAYIDEHPACARILSFPVAA